MQMEFFQKLNNWKGIKSTTDIHCSCIWRCSFYYCFLFANMNSGLCWGGLVFREAEQLGMQSLKSVQPWLKAWN